MFEKKIPAVMIAAALLALAATAVPQAAAAGTHFARFDAQTGSVSAGSLPEQAPFRFSSPHFSQIRIADRPRQIKSGEPNSGNWDMITANESGPEAGRYLFMPFEASEAGVQRLDLKTGLARTLVRPGTQNFTKGDASRWTPWGGYLTAEESWGKGSAKGRLFELANPVTAAGPDDSRFIHRAIVPRVAHEGLAFDRENSLYFVDEFEAGHIYKYVSAHPAATTGDEYFSAGQTFVLQVKNTGGDREGNGRSAGTAGSFAWVPITGPAGDPIPGVTVLNPDGSVDGRETAAVAGGTAYRRPEDIEIKTLPGGDQMLFVATTGSHEVYSINLDSGEVKRFVGRDTPDRATGRPVGTALANPDNLAIDADGNIYIVEDQPAGMADIWSARDADNDGVADSVARWASLSTLGAEPTGLYFDKFDANVAYVNVQHPDSLADSTIMISAIPPNVASAMPPVDSASASGEPEQVPPMLKLVPVSLLLSGAGLAGFIVLRRSAGKNA